MRFCYATGRRLGEELGLREKSAWFPAGSDDLASRQPGLSGEVVVFERFDLLAVASQNLPDFVKA
ncbi:MAG: hypothetical protein QOC89_4574 [Paraburkholderia sp.]|jgi:hypothetical protein|nr:hypothetical protein [Paraburkholderia sp.]MEA3128303.1 hypothetical protein [Paraburkholderia sp.]